MSIKVAQNDFTRKMVDFDTFTKMPRNVGDLCKLIVAKRFKSCPKSNKSSNLVTLSASKRSITINFYFNLQSQSSIIANRSANETETDCLDICFNLLLHDIVIDLNYNLHFFSTTKLNNQVQNDLTFQLTNEILLNGHQVEVLKQNCISFYYLKSLVSPVVKQLLERFQCAY